MASAEANRIDGAGAALFELSRALASAIAHPLFSALAEGAIAPINRKRAESWRRADSRRLVDDLLPKSLAS
jgi:hypothetical protein